MENRAFMTFARLRAAGAACALALGLAAPAAAQSLYPSPQAAADAFVDAMATGDLDALAKVLAPFSAWQLPM